MRARARFHAVLLALACSAASGLAPSAQRRAVVRTSFHLVAAAGLAPAHAADGPVVLTEEEMAARVARKQELLRQRSGGGGAPVSSLDVRSDVNPEAGVNLRARSLEDNLRGTLAKQAELKARDTKTKRDDMCEMLGRGC